MPRSDTDKPGAPRAAWRATLALGVAAAAAGLARPAAAAAADGGPELTSLQRAVGLTSTSFVTVSQKAEATWPRGTKALSLVFASEASGGAVAKYACSVGGQPAPGAFRGARAGAADPFSVSVPLPSGSSDGTVECTVTRVGPAARRPFPAKVPQTGRHRFLFEGESTRAVTAHPLRGAETTTVSLPAGKVESFSSDVKPAAQSGRTVTYGPYSGAPSAEELASRIRVHYEHNEPFLMVRSAVREVEVSHWGNVAVEENVDLVHAGAELEGFFSRLEHTQREPAAATQSIRARLPPNAGQLYYRDAMGNVSTSIVLRRRDSTDLDLKFRFPLYGGWHIEWYHGYNAPLASFVSRDEVSGRYALDFDVGLPFKDMVAEQLTLHVVLPAGATDAVVEAPVAGAYGVASVTTNKTRLTWLDVPWSPRPLVIIELRNHVAEFKRGSLRVTYALRPGHLAEKPLAVAAAFLGLYVVAFLVGRISASMGAPSGRKRKQL